MDFLGQVGMALMVLAGSCMVLVRGKLAAMGLAMVIMILTRLKHLPLWLTILILVVTILGLLLERLVGNWAKGRTAPALFSGLTGSVIMILFYGLFFGTVMSLILWLLTLGLQLLPRFRTKDGWLPYFANAIYRICLSLSFLTLGLYTVYAK